MTSYEAERQAQPRPCRREAVAGPSAGAPCWASIANWWTSYLSGVINRSGTSNIQLIYGPTA